MEHFPAIQASRAKWMSWIKDRIGGGSASQVRRGVAGCGKNTFVEGFNTNHTVHSVTPNWLFDWQPSPQDGWKMSL
jgi:hypothetical protein